MEIYCISIKHAKCFLVKVEDFYIAIDAGWPGHMNEYMHGLQQYNIDPEKIEYLFVTHFHPDHAGLIENIKKFGTGFVVFEHQIPYIKAMEKMIGNDRFYLPVRLDTSVAVKIDESETFLRENDIPARAVKTPGHSEDSISIVFYDGSTFIGDLYSRELIMEEDDKSRQSWHELEKIGAAKIYPAHGIDYTAF